MLWVNAFSLDPERSAAGAIANLAIFARHRLVNPGSDIVTLWRDGQTGSIRACYSHEAYLWLGDDEMDGEATVFFSGPRRQRSLWAPTFDTDRYRMTVFSKAPLSAKEAALFRAAAFDFLAADPGSRLAWVWAPPALRTRDFSSSTINPRGLILNLLAVACGSALVVWIMQRNRSGPVQTLADLRISRGLCPGCAYPMHGHDSSTCPECGGGLPGVPPPSPRRPVPPGPPTPASIRNQRVP
jgi:hypothetical protein